MTAALMVVVAAGVAVTILAERDGSARIAKMAASSAFVGLALTSGALDASFGRIVLAGLVLGWAGDLLLTFRSRLWFLGGLVAFGGGHVAYAVAFMIRGVEPAAATLAAAGMAVFALALLWWLIPHVGGEMRGPVVAYSVVISVMVVAAVGTHAHAPAPDIVMASAMFTISDVGVARDRFVASRPLNRIVGLPLYYAAQTLFAVAAGG